jgi:hypothetical protein
MKRTSFNPKRQIAIDQGQMHLNDLAENVVYRGNPAHKRNPGDFGMIPPLGPRPGKTLCDDAGIVNRTVAQQLLESGVRKGLVSLKCSGEYPQNIWAVSADGIPLEAQLENAGDGSYHGYPMPEADPFREKVIQKWNADHD